MGVVTNCVAPFHQNVRNGFKCLDLLLILNILWTSCCCYFFDDHFNLTTDSTVSLASFSVELRVVSTENTWNPKINKKCLVKGGRT